MISTILAQATTGQKVFGGLIIAGSGSYRSISLTQFIGDALNVLLGVLGLAFLILVIYAGILYLIDLGQEEQVKKAKKLLGNAVIGLVLIVGAYAISTFVFTALQEATKGGSAAPAGAPSASDGNPPPYSPPAAPATIPPESPTNPASRIPGVDTPSPF